MKSFKVIFLVVTVFCSHVRAQNYQLINWFAGADIVGTSGDSDADLESSFYVREFEFSAYSSIDQTFDGIMTLAYHQELEGAEEHLEVHEAFLFSSKLFHLANVKIGKFFLGFGRLNRFHRHDWVFTDAPIVQKSFFGNEGAKDTGLEYKRNLLDLESTLTLGLTSGNEFNHTGNHDHEEEGEEHAASEKAKAPTAYIRFAKFIEFSTTHGIELGLNAINRRDAESNAYQYAGLDFIYKDREGKYLAALVQSEIWARKSIQIHDGEEETSNDIGAYLYLERGLDQHHAFGTRIDYYKPEKLEEEEGEEHEHSTLDGLAVEDEYKGISLSYIYTNSEFMKTRLTLDYGNGIHVEDDEDKDSFSRFFLQFVFNIGAHPAHVY